MNSKKEANFNNKNSFLTNFEKVFIKKNLTFGQRAVDVLTRGAGSWIFIFSFLFFISLWMAVNIYFLFHQNPFDPYPFILLNLVLSCLAAIQAPIILMSQNRTNQKDRIRAEYDYAVNRRAEKEIREIHNVIKSLERKIIK